MKTNAAKSLLIRRLFILNLFLALLKFESALLSTADFSSQPYQTTIELVVAPTHGGTPDFSHPDISAKPDVDVSIYQVCFSGRYKHALFDYNNFVNQQLKAFKYTSTPNHKSFTFLQKFNIWHKSSDEVPLLFG